MKRYLPLLLAAFAAPMALAQDMQLTGPAQPPGPQQVQVEPDGKCRVVRPGDVVHFTLTIQSVEYAKAVYADLQMRQGRIGSFDPSALPMPDFRTFGGGGAATRDAQQGGVYHFSFKVQPQVLSGIYRGAGVHVTLDDDGEVVDRTRSVEVTRHTRDEIYKYCLNVVSPLGNDHRPLVTNFKGGPIDRK